MKLSKTMRDELGSVLSAHPDSIHDFDRDAEEWVRMAPKPTVVALMTRGLVDRWQYDYPCGGYRAHLTPEGVEARRAIIAEGSEARRAIKRILGAS